MQPNCKKISRLRNCKSMPV